MSALIPLDLPLATGLEQGQQARIAPAVELAGVFSPEECARIVARREVLGFDQAPIPMMAAGAEGSTRSHAVDPDIRRTERTHLLPGRDHAWIFDRVGQAVQTANAQAWQFKVAYMEPMQLLCYPVGGHFHWHSDLGDRGLSSLRKVSASILLSDSQSYDGGDFQLLNGGLELTTGRSQGRGIFFPSFQNHRVTPVTRGLRYVLILWTVGKHSLR